MRILVVSPGFHGYAAALGRTWASLGHDARVHVYDGGRSPRRRLAMRALQRDAENLRAARARAMLSARAIAVLNDYRPDAVLVVRGDALDEDWWDALRRSGARHLTWMYDELRRMRYSPGTLGEIGMIASYSALDVADMAADGLDVHHLPLGYDALEPVADRRLDAVSLIGARYRNREVMLQQVADAGIAVKAFGREWSRHPVDILRTGQRASPGVPVGRQLKRFDAYGIMRGSVATLNMHSDQDGFTMRTFEAPGVGAVELCDRDDVAEFYDLDSEVAVFRGPDELVDQCRRAMVDTAWAERIRAQGRARTLAEHTLAHRLREVARLWA